MKYWYYWFFSHKLSSGSNFDKTQLLILPKLSFRSLKTQLRDLQNSGFCLIAEMGWYKKVPKNNPWYCNSCVLTWCLVVVVRKELRNRKSLLEQQAKMCKLQRWSGQQFWRGFKSSVSSAKFSARNAQHNFVAMSKTCQGRRRRRGSRLRKCRANFRGVWLLADGRHGMQNRTMYVVEVL